jgi:branched-chain amino acid transport system ATP-binding protein
MNALRVEDLHVHYGTIHAVRGVSFHVNRGEIVSIVGSNGAGKSTIMWTLAGVTPSSKGTVELFGRQRPLKPHEIVAEGLALVPERRRLFSSLTVEENLLMGAYRLRGSKSEKESMEKCFHLFPILRERMRQRSGTLSGGEQQMLAISRALMSGPEMLLMDEPTLGLAPLLVETVMETVVRLRREGITVLLVEQNAARALEISDRGYIIEAGEIVRSGPGPELSNDPEIRRVYLGG